LPIDRKNSQPAGLRRNNVKNAAIAFVVLALVVAGLLATVGGMLSQQQQGSHSVSMLSQQQEG